MALRRVRITKHCKVYKLAVLSAALICTLLLVTIVLGKPNLVDSLLMLLVERETAASDISTSPHFLRLRYNVGPSWVFVS